MTNIELEKEIERLSKELSLAQAMHKVAIAERNYERMKVDRLRDVLRGISLGAQNSMHSKEALGKEAREALSSFQ
jgi:hypothetical protein